MIAALYVETDGAYFCLPDVDPWDEKRDARQYAGPWPVVAHPPCRNWSILGNCRPEIIRGDDGGCFAAALAAVRRFGGVLEHPRYSAAWSAYGLPYATRGGWTASLTDPGLVTEVDQGNYGHPNVKPTWLYCVGIDLPPRLRWETSTQPTYRTKRSGGGNGKGGTRPDHSRTPPAFRDALLAMAGDARPSFDILSEPRLALGGSPPRT